MEYKLELRPTERKEGMKYRTILLTDIMLHASKRRTSTFSDKIKRAFNMVGVPGRIYQQIQKTEDPNSSKINILSQLQNDPDFIKYVTEEREKGIEIVIQIPKAGLPVLAGKDTVEFIKSKNGQRIIRGLAKDKPVD